MRTCCLSEDEFKLLQTPLFLIFHVFEKGIEGEFTEFLQMTVNKLLSFILDCF